MLLATLPSGATVPYFSLLFLIIYIIPVILYLITLQKTLNAISPPNRKIESGLVWLMLIPLFNIIWNFVLAKKIADSLETEFRQLGQDMNGKPLFNLGIFCSVMYLLCYVAQLIQFGWLLTLSGLVVWIMYWKKIAEYKNALIRLKAI